MNPPPTWVLILRPFLILGCTVMGFIAFRHFVVTDTLFDSNSEPKWSRERIDTYSARKLMSAGKYAEAVAILNTILADTPNHGCAHKYLGRIYLQRHEFDNARKHYLKAQTYCPGDEEPGIALTTIEHLNSQQPDGELTQETAPIAAP